MAYAIQNAIFQWEEGTRRLRDAREPDRLRVERAAAAVLDELRRRLGSRFTLSELAGFYAESGDWAERTARENQAGYDSSWVIDAAFGRYAREAVDFAGGRERR